MSVYSGNTDKGIVRFAVRLVLVYIHSSVTMIIGPYHCYTDDGSSGGYVSYVKL
jgi:hypothetical protein